MLGEDEATGGGIEGLVEHGVDLDGALRWLGGCCREWRGWGGLGRIELQRKRTLLEARLTREICERADCKRQLQCGSSAEECIIQGAVEWQASGWKRGSDAETEFVHLQEPKSGASFLTPRPVANFDNRCLLIV